MSFFFIALLGTYHGNISARVSNFVFYLVLYFMVHQNRLARYCASSPFIYKAKKLGVGLIRSRASVSLNSARELYLQSFLIDNRSRNMSFTLGMCDVSALIKTLHDMIHYAVSLRLVARARNLSLANKQEKEDILMFRMARKKEGEAVYV